MCSAARYLELVRPLARTPEDAALAAAAIATAAALPSNPLLVQAVPSVTPGALTASGEVPARKRKADFLVHEHSVLWSLLPFIYGDIKHALGPNLNQKLSNMGAWLNPFPGYFGVPPPQYAPSLKPVQQLARGMTSWGQGVSTRLNSAQQASGRSAPFMGLPASAEVIGPKLAVWRGPAAAGRQVCRACGPSAGHCGWECPVRYASVFGAPCPGFTAAGDHVVSDWSGPDLTAKACVAWKVFSATHSLVCARPVPGPPAF